MRGALSAAAVRAHLTVAARRLRRRPATTLAAIAVLAIGLGATTALFSLLETVALRPLPFAHAGELLHVGVAVPGQSELQEVSWPRFEAIVAASTGRLRVAAYYPTTFGAADREGPTELAGARISDEFVAALGVAPILGRVFSAEESRLGGADVALLAEPFWRSRFDADADVVGRVVQVDGRPTTIVGVLPASLDAMLRGVQIWLPRPQEASFLPPGIQERGAGYLQIVAQRLDGVTAAAAQSLLDRVDESYVAARPGQFDSAYRLRAVDFTERLLGAPRETLTAMFGGVVLLLIVAAVDLAGLLWLEGLARRRESALRAALGASPRQLLGEAVAEGALLAAVGGACGLALAAAALAWLRANGPGDLPRLDTVALSPAALGVTLVSLVTVGLAAMIWPVWNGSRADAGSALAESSRGAAGGVSQGRAQRGLVAAQLALATVLLSSAGLFARSLRQVEHLELGFAPDRLELTSLTLPPVRYADDEARRARFTELVERARRLPGAEAAALTEYPPSFGAPHTRVESAEHEPLPPAEQLVVQRLVVSPGFVAALGVRLVAGGDFEANPAAGAPPTALVSRSLATRLFGEEPAIGRRLRVRGSDAPHEIVGVFEEFRQQPLELDFEPTVLLSLAELRGGLAPPESMSLVVRVAPKHGGLAPAVRSLVGELDPAQAVSETTTMRSLLRAATARRRLAAGVIAAFSALATALATFGVFGVVARATAARRRELAVRLALGATPREVVGATLAGAASWAVPGLVVGTAGAALAARAVAGQLFGVATAGVAHLGATAVTLAAAAALAAWLPGRAAGRIAPVAALRQE